MKRSVDSFGPTFAPERSWQISFVNGLSLYLFLRCRQGQEGRRPASERACGEAGKKDGCRQGARLDGQPAVVLGGSLGKSADAVQALVDSRAAGSATLQSQKFIVDLLA